MIKKIILYYKKIFWEPEKYARSIGVKIGNNCLISSINFSSEPYLIEIGDYCRIANNVSFYTHGGLWSQRKKTGESFDFFGKIKIGDYTYVGDGAKIMPGVTLGNDVIIGAGSIITKSVPNGKIAAGNPARIVGETIDFITKIKKYNVGTKGMSYHNKKEFLLSLSEEQFLVK